jgi:hypothetical protein
LSPDTRSRSTRILLRLARLPLLALVTVYFLLDEVVVGLFRPMLRWLAGLRPIERTAAAILALPPLATLLVFAVPFVILEPIKIWALVLIAGGNLASGSITLALAHLTSILFVERLFHLTKPKLLTIRWFAWGYGHVERLWDWSLGRLEATALWRSAAAVLAGLKRTARGLLAVLVPVGRALVAGLRRLLALIGPGAKAIVASLGARLTGLRARWSDRGR